MLHAQYLQNQPVVPPRSFPLNQPPFLTNNWRSIQADNEYKDYPRYVRVTGGVANVTNGYILVRSQLNMPDGFYIIGHQNELVQTFPSLSLREAFPDINSVAPRMANLEHSPPLCQEEVANFVGFLNFIREGHSEVRSDVGIHMDHRTAAERYDGGRYFTFSVDLPVKYEGLNFEANHLRLAFTEMLRYDHIYVSRDNDPGQLNPLIVGQGWDRCVVISAGYR